VRGKQTGRGIRYVVIRYDVEMVVNKPDVANRHNYLLQPQIRLHTPLTTISELLLHAQYRILCARIYVTNIEHQPHPGLFHKPLS